MAFHSLVCIAWNFLPVTPMTVFVWMFLESTHSIYLIYCVYPVIPKKTRASKLSSMTRHDSLRSEQPLHVSLTIQPLYLFLSSPSPASSLKPSWIIPVPIYWHGLAFFSNTFFLQVLDFALNYKSLEGKCPVLWFLWLPSLIFHLSSGFLFPQTQQDTKLGTSVQVLWWLFH